MELSISLLQRLMERHDWYELIIPGEGLMFRDFGKDVSFWGTRPQFTDSHVVFQNEDNYLDVTFDKILE